MPRGHLLPVVDLDSNLYRHRLSESFPVARYLTKEIVHLRKDDNDMPTCSPLPRPLVRGGRAVAALAQHGGDGRLEARQHVVRVEVLAPGLQHHR